MNNVRRMPIYLFENTLKLEKARTLEWHLESVWVSLRIYKEMNYARDSQLMGYVTKVAKN